MIRTKHTLILPPGTLPTSRPTETMKGLLRTIALAGLFIMTLLPTQAQEADDLH